MAMCEMSTKPNDGNIMDKEMQEYIKKYGVDITGHDPEDNPDDEKLIPPEHRE